MIDTDTRGSTPPRPSPWPIRVGVGGSVLWLAFFAAFTVSRRTDFADLELNEVGDYLAGAFAPLAFLWLVVGYLQQSAELRLQVTELTHQVNATRDLAMAAQARERRDSLKAQPVLLPGSSTWHGKHGKLSLKNMGAQITHLKIEDVRGQFKTGKLNRTVLGFSQTVDFGLAEGDFAWVQLAYEDANHAEQSCWVLFSAEHQLCRALSPGEQPIEDRDDAIAWLRNAPVAAVQQAAPAAGPSGRR